MKNSTKSCSNKDADVDERGQAVLEVALSVPLLVILCLFIVQVGGVMFAQLAVTQAAREGARAAAVNPSAGIATEAVHRATQLNEKNLMIHMDTRNGDRFVRVEVRYRTEITFPLTNRMLYEHTVKGVAVMRNETFM